MTLAGCEKRQAEAPELQADSLPPAQLAEPVMDQADGDGGSWAVSPTFENVGAQKAMDDDRGVQEIGKEATAEEDAAEQSVRAERIDVEPQPQ
jgi:hypothetical protein